MNYPKCERCGTDIPSLCDECVEIVISENIEHARKEHEKKHPPKRYRLVPIEEDEG